MFSKYLNQRLIFIEPDFEDTGKLGVKVDGKWFNGSMALLFGNVIQVHGSENFKNIKLKCFSIESRLFSG